MLLFLIFFGKMVQMKLLVWLPVFLWCLLGHGASGVDTEEVSVSVMEGDSVTLYTRVKTHQQDRIRWYYKGTRIAQINRDQSKICTDVQCKEGNGRFRDRLKLDHQTGSLTIMNTRNTDAGVYTLKISSGSSESEKIFIVSVTDVSGVDTDGVSVMEGGPVTLNTGVQTNQQDSIRWYYNDILIAEITVDLSQICTDVQCNEDTERFRDRLKLDHQTGSLTIINITNTHSGEYTLMISSSSSDSDKIFIVSVSGFSGRDEMKRKTVNEGELVTLDPRVERNPNDVMTWYLNGICIAEINRDQSKICTDDQCKECFGDRLKLDHQTGSLNITNTRHTHSGEYKLQINNSRFSVMRSFSVSVTAVPDSSPAVIGGVCAGVAVILLAAAVIYSLYRSKHKRNGTLRGDQHQENGGTELEPLKQTNGTARVDDGNWTCHNESETPQLDDCNGTSHNETGTPQLNDGNWTCHNETETPQLDDGNGTSHYETETAPMANGTFSSVTLTNGISHRGVLLDISQFNSISVIEASTQY